MNKIGRAREFPEMFTAPTKCSECVAFHAEGNLSVPCNGDFWDHCEYNGTEEEEEDEQE